jgi:nucleoid DNA-binding protein
MTNKQIINELSKRTKFKQKELDNVLNELTNLIIELSYKGFVCHFKNFGSFRLVQKKKRICYNPQTMGRVIIPPRKQIVFNSSKQLQ